MANETPLTVIGNLADKPELRYTPDGVPVAVFTTGYAINSGGGAVGSFMADANFAGSANTFSVTIIRRARIRESWKPWRAPIYSRNPVM